ncbi:MAG: DUF429 domain-containing protein [Gemmatimonadota bacterium]|nr:DUF429 domain-containing protein [Gemmatimonadota bacterium]
MACARLRRRRSQPLRLEWVESLEELSGTADRGAALRHLVGMVRDSSAALWAIDAPFGLPIEILDEGTSWREVLQFVERWEADGYDLGLWALDRARAARGVMHIRRETDHLAKAPFDPYHYRIIYQTFHAIRDVAGPLSRVRETAVLPFQYRRLARAERVVVETCPSSTLKRLGLPHQNYKQPAGGPLTALRRRTRSAILRGLLAHVELEGRERRRIARDPGGDALDAVIAAVGAASAWRQLDHGAIARSPRIRREGYLYF